jgi:GMP synthase-like glutamine amidotransferase
MSKNVVLFIQNYATDPPHLVSEWLAEVGLTTETIRAFDGEPVPDVLSDEVVALIPLGGAMNAMQDAQYPWLTDEKKLIKKSVESGLPVLGICLGAQLLGAALGGTVSRLDSNEIGIYTINQVIEDPIMNVGMSAPATQWHEDYVSVLPKGATLIADSPLCPTQIFKVAELSYGLQCHPEADASIVALWEAKPDNAFSNFDGAPVDATVASTVAAHEGDLKQTWRPIIQNWGRAVLHQASVK